jgi:phosphoribosylglycinamide formyltransferase-1
VKKRLAVFVSGGGSNFQAILDEISGGHINAEVAVLISSSSKAYANKRAEDASIPVQVFKEKDFPSSSDMYAKLIEVLDSFSIDYIVLAGYMKIITSNFISHYRRKIINIHPSLIPKYCGVGFYGHFVHEAVIANGELESGATVHFVDEGVDTGEIIDQISVPVFEDDTPITLAARILEKEHIILPKALKMLCKD